MTTSGLLIDLFFYEKILSVKKALTSKNQPKNQNKANSKQQRQHCSCAQKLLRGWKLFALRFGDFSTLKIFSQKKNKQAWNLSDNLIILYY